MIFVMFFLFASLGLTFMLSKTIYQDLQSYRMLANSKQSYFAAESGVEDVVYRYLTSGLAVDLTEGLTLADASVITTSVLDTGNAQLLIDGVGTENTAVRKVSATLLIGSGASFNFGVQTGNGGFLIRNGAKVIGNVFSNGNITGVGNTEIQGDVIAAGPGRTVDNITATGTIRADNIENSTIGTNMDAFYGTSFVNNSYSGTVYGPGWPNEATSSLPFPDEKVDDHKATVTAAIAAGDAWHIQSTDPECSGGTMTINTSTTTGMMKIDCDVEVDGNTVVWTVTDTVWIEGNLNLKKPQVLADPDQATTSVLIIVDNESDRINSSMVDIEVGTDFDSTGASNSYIMILSMNDDAENGGHADPATANNAIGMSQPSNGRVILYAGHGKIEIRNSATLKEITAYFIEMGQNTEVAYESGLVNLNFTSGPGGGFQLDAWGESE